MARFARCRIFSAIFAKTRENICGSSRFELERPQQPAACALNPRYAERIQQKLLKKQRRRAEGLVYLPHSLLIPARAPSIFPAQCYVASEVALTIFVAGVGAIANESRHRR